MEKTVMDLEKRMTELGFEPTYIYDVPMGVIFDGESMQGFDRKRLKWCWENGDFYLQNWGSEFQLVPITQEVSFKMANMFPTPVGTLEFVEEKLKEYYQNDKKLSNSPG